MANQVMQLHGATLAHATALSDFLPWVDSHVKNRASRNAQGHAILHFIPWPLGNGPPHSLILLIPPLRVRAPSPNVCLKARDTCVAGAGFV